MPKVAPKGHSNGWGSCHRIHLQGIASAESEGKEAEIECFLVLCFVSGTFIMAFLLHLSVSSCC